MKDLLSIFWYLFYHLEIFELFVKFLLKIILDYSHKMTYLDFGINLWYNYINELVRNIISNIDVKNVKNNLLEIYIKDDYIEEYKLKNLAQLIEYGNREIAPSRYLTILMNRSLMATKSNLGGL